MSLHRIEISPEQLASEAESLTSRQLDELPFGVIRLDERGMVTTYNRYEETFAGRNREEVIGRDFFREVAPCTSVKEFRGAFETGARRGELSEIFDFTFRFPEGERTVRIRMIATDHGGRGVWIFVTPLES